MSAATKAAWDSLTAVKTAVALGATLVAVMDVQWVEMLVWMAEMSAETLVWRV